MFLLSESVDCKIIACGVFPQVSHLFVHPFCYLQNKCGDIPTHRTAGSINNADIQ